MKRRSEVFVSYRRRGASGYAGRIAESLTTRVGKRIFVDIGSISPGDDFTTAIANAIRQARIVVVVIHRDWLNYRTDGGEPALDDPNDLVRREIAAAFEHGVRVIPVLVDGATMPSETDLPPDIAPLARRQAMTLTDAEWPHQMDRLSQVIRAATRRRSPLRVSLYVTAVLAIVLAAAVLLNLGRRAETTATSIDTAAPRRLADQQTPVVKSLRTDIASAKPGKIPLNARYDVTLSGRTAEGEFVVSGILMVVPCANPDATYIGAVPHPLDIGLKTNASAISSGVRGTIYFFTNSRLTEIIGGADHVKRAAVNVCTVVANDESGEVKIVLDPEYALGNPLNLMNLRSGILSIGKQIVSGTIDLRFDGDTVEGTVRLSTGQYATAGNVEYSAKLTGQRSL